MAVCREMEFSVRSQSGFWVGQQVGGGTNWFCRLEAGNLPLPDNDPAASFQSF